MVLFKDNIITAYLNSLYDNSFKRFKKKRPVLSFSNLLLPGSTIYTDLFKKLYIHQYENVNIIFI